MLKQHKGLLKYTVILAGLALPLTSQYAYAGATGVVNDMRNTTPHFVMDASLKHDTALSFVEDLTQNGIAFLQDKSLSADQKMSAFERFLDQNFDMNTISRFALGKYWKVSTPQQRDEYASLFKDMIVSVYTRRLNEYNGEKIVVETATERGRDTLVSSSVLPPSGSAIDITWRIREKNGDFKVIDIIIENVSMTLTQRSEFSSIIQRGGGDVDVLLNHLRAR